MPASPPGVTAPPDPSFRQRVLAGDQLLGTFLNLGSSLTAEIVALAGFDWALVDTEHGPGAEWHAVAQLQALGRTPGLVRVESLERTRILRALDAGAAGVLVPRLESVGGRAARGVLRALRRRARRRPLQPLVVLGQPRAARWPTRTRPW